MPGPAGFGPDDKRWAQRATELQFQELAGVRSAAQQWRTGLAGLTALLSVTSIVVAPNLSDRLTQPWYVTVGLLAFAGLLALLYGTWEAMRAAFGTPGDAVIMTGERLRKWESDQARSGAAGLARARAATLVGMSLLVTTAAVVFIAAPRSTGQLVIMQTDSEVSCGSLAKSDLGRIAVVGRDGTVHSAAVSTVKSLATTASC